MHYDTLVPVWVQWHWWYLNPLVMFHGVSIHCRGFATKRVEHVSVMMFFTVGAHVNVTCGCELAVRNANDLRILHICEHCANDLFVLHICEHEIIHRVKLLTSKLGPWRGVSKRLMANLTLYHSIVRKTASAFNSRKTGEIRTSKLRRHDLRKESLPSSNGTGLDKPGTMLERRMASGQHMILRLSVKHPQIILTRNWTRANISVNNYESTWSVIWKHECDWESDWEWSSWIWLRIWTEKNMNLIESEWDWEWIWRLFESVFLPAHCDFDRQSRCNSLARQWFSLEIKERKQQRNVNYRRNVSIACRILSLPVLALVMLTALLRVRSNLAWFQDKISAQRKVTFTCNCLYWLQTWMVRKPWHNVEKYSQCEYCEEASSISKSPEVKFVIILSKASAHTNKQRLQKIITETNYKKNEYNQRWKNDYKKVKKCLPRNLTSAQTPLPSCCSLGRCVNKGMGKGKVVLFKVHFGNA